MGSLCVAGLSAEALAGELADSGIVRHLLVSDVVGSALKVRCTGGAGDITKLS